MPLHQEISNRKTEQSSYQKRVRTINKKYLLTEGNVWKALLFFVIPIILGSLIQQLYITTDTMIVGRYVGKTGLAAIDSVHTLFKFPVNFMNGLAAGVTIVISGYYGAKDRENLHCSIRTAITVAILLGIFCAVAGVLLTPALLNIMDVPEEVYLQAMRYCQVYFESIWAMILYNMSAGILRAMGNTHQPLLILIFSSIMNIGLDFVFIKGFQWGVQGAALATAVAQILSMIWILNSISKQEKGLGQKKVWHLHFCKEHMLIMVKKGFPLALQSMMFPAANSIVQAAVNQMGTNAIAAWGICDKMDMLIWLVSDAIGPAMTAYVAQNIGAGKRGRVKKGIAAGLTMSVAAVAVISSVLYWKAEVIGNWFLTSTDASAIIPLIIQYMRVMAPFFIFYTVSEVCSGVCCGEGHTMETMIMTLLTICLLRIVAVWAILPIYRNMECIVWIYVASWIVSGVAFPWMMLFSFKTQKFRF